MSEAAPARRRGRDALLLVLAAVAFLMLVGLGTWQVQRLQWKEGLLARIAERVDAAPRTLDEVEAIRASTGDVEYLPVTVSGRFRHEGERHYFATFDGQPGYFVHTPLQLADGRLLFVNRGFVPFDRKAAQTRVDGQVEGRVEVTGLARGIETEKPSFIVPDNDLEQNVFYWKDLGAMAQTAGVGSPEDYVPLIVDADDAPNPGGLPVGGVTRIELPNSHLQYAVTWYGLALALAGVVGAWLWRGRRGHTGDAAARD